MASESDVRSGSVSLELGSFRGCGLISEVALPADKLSLALPIFEVGF